MPKVDSNAKRGFKCRKWIKRTYENKEDDDGDDGEDHDEDTDEEACVGARAIHGVVVWRSVKKI